MRGITVRFGDTTYEQIKQEAQREGMSMGAFIREAAFARTMLLMARRGELPSAERGEPLMQAVRAYLAAEPSSESPDS